MRKSAVALMALLAAVCVQPSSAQTPVARVYVQTINGLKLYDAASNGRLTLVAGSPFNVVGQLVGISGSHLITSDTYKLHVYALASNGVVKGQVAHVSTQSYNGKQCGPIQFAFTDRTGQDVYVILNGTKNQNQAILCNAIQSFKVTSSGTISYLGTILPYDNPSGTAYVYYFPAAFTGDNVYGYGTFAGLTQGCNEPDIVAFRRETSGELELAGTQSVTLPEPESGAWKYIPYYLSADSGNHFAVFVVPEENGPCGTRGTPQLASFTANTNGSFVSTNTYQNMPATPPTSGTGIKLGPISPSNKILPVALGNNLQLFHMNGANPITPETGQVPASGFMTYLQWDKSGHLYGLDTYSGKLRVYAVTTSGMTLDPGSPVTVSASYYSTGMLVVPE